MVVEPRLGEEKIEIHTPAAIATVLGTILHIAVDTNGITTITSEVSRVLVESANPTIPGQTTVSGGEQIVIHPDQAPPERPAKLSSRGVASLSGCLLDFHGAALSVDRAATVDAAVRKDTAVAALPQVSGDRFRELQISPTVDDPAQEPFPTAVLPDDQLFQMSPNDSCASGIPGETCYRVP